MGDGLPKNRAGFLVQTEDFPLLDVVIIRRSRVSVQAHFQRRIFALVHRRGDKQTITPNDRAGMSEARNRRFPKNIFRRLRVPGCNGRSPCRDAQGMRPAKRRPVCLRACRDCKRQGYQYNQTRQRPQMNHAESDSSTKKELLRCAIASRHRPPALSVPLKSSAPDDLVPDLTSIPTSLRRLSVTKSTSCWPASAKGTIKNVPCAPLDSRIYYFFIDD